jgi:hypothetical protein
MKMQRRFYPGWKDAFYEVITAISALFVSNDRQKAFE